MRSRHNRPPLLNRRQPPSARSGFTLIELLVVIAIISLLMSILTPSLSRARQQAKSALCLTRLSEFMKATTAYGNDNNFLLPPTMYEVAQPDDASPPPGMAPLHGWAEALYQYLYGDKDYPMDEDFPVQRNRRGRYELWLCKEGIPLANSTGHYRVYELSWNKGTLDLINPRLPLIMDANPKVTDPYDLRMSYIPREHLAGLEGEAYIDERHYGGTNYAFNDGHAVRSTNLKEQLAEDWDLNPDTLNR
ncbi:MAG: type II secretion system protein [Phycisphaerae bacterium]|jgi:prepilin-type N-terminal cleavage/methylation domain-containing protein/prepilin-type processing-associated H-X9-DG protein